ncbi:hypothetical protein MMC28_000732 [Mycoblastus sanguinarius]|nr:hypothetical protein [Mycoblastus sanguinarius]
MIHFRHKGGLAFAQLKFCRSYSSFSKWRPLGDLPNDSLEAFRTQAFAPSKPALLSKGQFLGLPAIQKWFLTQGNTAGASLNQSYLSQYGSAIVPLEFTRLSIKDVTQKSEVAFQRAEAPLQIFLDWAQAAMIETPERLYLAQASFASLPKPMTEDLPTPEIVAKAGTGDIYDTNIWMGIPPTYTPLHRDPNPNLFVQLAGRKVVRMLPPAAGEKVFASVQASLGRGGSAAFRGDEMMKGEENNLLEAEVWSDASPGDNNENIGYEAHVGKGDGLFIPLGWWHSIRGIGEGVTGSVNWWFR